MRAPLPTATATSQLVATGNAARADAARSRGRRRRLRDTAASARAAARGGGGRASTVAAPRALEAKGERSLPAGDARERFGEMHASQIIRASELRAPRPVGHVGARAARDDLAAFHHQVLVGQRLGEVVVLLDQQDGHVRRVSASMRMTRPMSLMMMGWMPSVGSSRISSLGPTASARRDGQLLLLAAGEVAAAAVHHLLEHREQLEERRRDRRAAGLGGQAHAQVFLDREAREDLAALRHVADAGADALVRRRVRDVLAVEARCVPVLVGTRPIRRLEQRGLAHAVAAEQRGDLAGLAPRRRRRAGCGCRRSTG